MNTITKYNMKNSVKETVDGNGESSVYRSTLDSEENILSKHI